MKKRFYYTGIRNIYFYLKYLMCMSYFRPPYLQSYKYQGDVIILSNGNNSKFGLLYDKKIIKKFLHFYQSNPKKLSDITKKIEEEKKKVFKKYGKFKASYLKNINNKKLFEIYLELLHLIRSLIYLNQIVWHLDIAFLEFQKKKINYDESEINLLMQPDAKNYLQEEEIAFLKLCVIYFKNKKKINILLKKHLNKYAYIGISYFNEPPKNMQDIKKKNYEFVKKGYKSDDIKEILDKKEKSFKDKISLRNKLFSRIKSKEIRTSILLLREAVYLKDYFRGSLSEIIYLYFNAILKEIANRSKINEKNIKNLTITEIERLFGKKKINWKNVNKRQNKHAIGTSNHKYFIYYGKNAKNIERYFTQDVEKVTELKGIPANKGLVKGTARIILTHDDFWKFKKEDILIANNTMPEYTPLIHKAKAIVTDLGAMTSHAAIVSRELDIPCVIGTKIATKVFKDGDLVEVDANKGIVKLLKRK